MFSPLRVLILSFIRIASFSFPEQCGAGALKKVEVYPVPHYGSFRREMNPGKERCPIGPKSVEAAWTRPRPNMCDIFAFSPGKFSYMLRG
jgi:hypothetical protein